MDVTKYYAENTSCVTEIACSIMKLWRKPSTYAFWPYAGLSKRNCRANRVFGFLLWEILKKNFGGEVVSDREAHCGLRGWMAAAENPG